MKLILTHTLTFYLAITFGISLLLSPAFLLAATAQSSIYQEIITNHTSDQLDRDTVMNTGSVHTTISQHTVINGKEYNYYFSTSTPTVLKNSVSTRDKGSFFLHTESVLDASTTNNTINATTTTENYQAWIISLKRIINSLQFYVAHSL